MWIILRAVCRGSVMTGFGLTWLMAWGGGSRPWVVGTSWISQVWMRGKIGFNQPVIYILPFPLSPIFFHSSLFISVAKKVFLGIKILGGGHLTPSPKLRLRWQVLLSLAVPRCMLVWCHEIWQSHTKKPRKQWPLARYERQSLDLCFPIVTVYETGVHHFDPESMLQ
jgi:hypothetical protein